MNLSDPVRSLAAFPNYLRQQGFTVSPDQTIGFLDAVGVLGPRGIDDIRSAALALLAIPNDRRPEFDALFRAYFLGELIAGPPAIERGDIETDAIEDAGGEIDVAVRDHPDAFGSAAAAAERLSRRQFMPVVEDAELARLTRLAPSRLPRRLSRRLEAASHGQKLDLRRTLRAAVRQGGETLTLATRRRRKLQRRILMLIDVSGSMKERTDWTLRLAHALASAADRLEVFTLGTRLTRITPVLAIRDRQRALSRIGGLAADIDGGTRLGDALQAFLNVPRYASFARGAAVVVVSDGLERGDPVPMADAVRRLSRGAWRLNWLTPLAADDEFDPRTRALALALPYIDKLGDGSQIASVSDHMLTLAERR